MNLGALHTDPFGLMNSGCSDQRDHFSLVASSFVFCHPEDVLENEMNSSLQIKGKNSVACPAVPVRPVWSIISFVCGGVHCDESWYRPI